MYPDSRRTLFPAIWDYGLYWNKGSDKVILSVDPILVKSIVECKDFSFLYISHEKTKKN
jgi:hypothetical protein